MADVHSAGKKVQMYKDPETGKMKVRMVPSKQDIKTEKTLTPAEKSGRERIAKKLPMKDFKKRYGDDAMQVKMATATKIAKNKYEGDKESTGMDETKGAPKGYHFTKSGELRKGDADVDGPGGKKLRADPLDKQRSKIPPLPEAVTYHGNPNKDDDARNAARRRALAKQDNLLRKRKAEKEEQVEENYNFKVSHSGKDVHVKARDIGHAIKKAQKGFGNMDLTKAKVKNLGRVGMPANEAVDPADTGGAEETSMAMKQIKAMHHFLDGIEQRVSKEGDMEEWFQNKLTKANDYLKNLYSYGKGATSESYEATDKPPFKGPYTKTGTTTKDQYGNVVKPKNLASFLAKKGMKAVTKESNLDEISPELKKRYTDKAKSDIEFTKRDLKIAKDMDVPDVKAKMKRKLQTRRVGVARATEPSVSKNVFDSVKKEAYRAPTQAEIDADKKKDNRGKSRPSMSAKSATSKVFKNMMGDLKKESVELGEASSWANAGRALHDYARKSGGMDKADFEKAATHLYKISKSNILQKGDHLNAFSKFFKELDTDVRDRIVIILKQNNLMESVEEATNKVKLKGFGPDAPKSNMGNSAARAALRTVKPKNKENTTEANFDQNFSKRIGATMRGGAGAEYLKKKADQRRARDPDAGKGLGPGVLDLDKARKKAAAKGVRPGSLRASPNTRDPKRLPEKNDYLQTDMKKRKQANDQAVADMKKDAPKHEPSWASNPGKKSFSDIYGKKK